MLIILNYYFYVKIHFILVCIIALDTNLVIFLYLLIFSFFYLFIFRNKTQQRLARWKKYKRRIMNFIPWEWHYNHPVLFLEKGITTTVLPLIIKRNPSPIATTLYVNWWKTLASSVTKAIAKGITVRMDSTSFYANQRSLSCKQSISKRFFLFPFSLKT